MVEEWAKQGTGLKHLCLLPGSCWFLGSSLTLKMEASCSYEMLIGLQQTTQHCIAEDRTLHNDCWGTSEPTENNFTVIL
jgi:hypothetical protein